MKDINEPTEEQSDPEKIFYNYLCKAYKVFLSGSDDFEGMIKELGANFGNLPEHVFIC
jgi:kinetochore protein NDC80